MHILTNVRRTRSLLSLQLRESGLAATFHETVVELCTALAQSEASEEVLIDIAYDEANIFHGALSEVVGHFKIIGFTFDQNFSSDDPRAKGFSDLLILSKHAERTRQRLKTVLRSGAKSGKKWPRRAPLGNRSGSLQAKPRFTSKLKLKLQSDAKEFS